MDFIGDINQDPISNSLQDMISNVESTLSAFVPSDKLEIRFKLDGKLQIYPEGDLPENYNVEDLSEDIEELEEIFNSPGNDPTTDVLSPTFEIDNQISLALDTLLNIPGEQIVQKASVSIALIVLFKIRKTGNKIIVSF